MTTEDQPIPLRVVDFKPKDQIANEHKANCQEEFRNGVMEALAQGPVEAAVFVSVNADGSYSIRHVGNSRLEAVGMLTMAAQMIVLRGMG